MEDELDNSFEFILDNIFQQILLDFRIFTRILSKGAPCGGFMNCIYILQAPSAGVRGRVFIFHKTRQSRQPTQKAAMLETSAMTTGRAGRLGAPAYQTAER